MGERSQGINHQVPALTLDTIFRQNEARISLIKIDTEGHEAAVLRGASTVLGECQPDVVIESVFGHDTATIEELFLNRGYRFYLIDDDQLEVRPVESLAPTTTAGAPHMGQLNRFATKRMPEAVQQIVELAQSRMKK